MTPLYYLDIIGTAAFAISGALVAMNKRLDPFGVFIIAFVTAAGGGTMRDILTGRLPVGWMQDINYMYAIIIATSIAIIFRKKLRFLSRTFFLFDTIGIGIFTIIGTEIGVKAGFHPVISIALGTMTACFGGVTRDILCNDIPIIFRKEIYAIACIVGAITFLVLQEFFENTYIIYIGTTLIVITVRLLAVAFKLSLPTFYSDNR
ncbi:MAG: trimeric intracellular cation channel family protein [Flavobacteriaceae bacterium]|nr:trimeric intracellular cation channel family protein [Flavobacteriaceae bacterium]